MAVPVESFVFLFVSFDCGFFIVCAIIGRRWGWKGRWIYMLSFWPNLWLLSKCHSIQQITPITGPPHGRYCPQWFWCLLKRSRMVWRWFGFESTSSIGKTHYDLKLWHEKIHRISEKNCEFSKCQDSKSKTDEKLFLFPLGFLCHLTHRKKKKIAE